MLNRLEITNYRSIAQASIDFRPFTILVGANGSGKSNLLKLLKQLSSNSIISLTRHYANPNDHVRVTAKSEHSSTTFFDISPSATRISELSAVQVFSIDASLVGQQEPLVANPHVETNGQGAIQVLDSLKTGDREDLFNTIERQLHTFIPEIEKLSFFPGSGTKRLQVREANIPVPVPVSELSEGTRLVLTILTIIYQERKPSIICIEDIDRGLHPALFGKVVEVCQALATSPGGPQIIATTHNPYLVDQFIDDEDAVILVEKVDGNTTFTSLRKRLEGLDRSDSLGAIWYSGLVGGAPKLPLKHLPPKADTHA